MITTPVESPLTEYLYRKASREGSPLSGTFELTPLCNMDCKMCYVRMSGAEQEAVRPLRTAEEWLSLARKAKQAGMLYLLLTGGEPFFHPQFRRIMTGLHEMGFVISLNTNGTMIDEATVQWLRQCPPSRINITLYGVSDATYSRLCGNPKGFSQVSKAIELLQQAGIPVKLNCSLTPHNAEDLPAIVDYAKERGLILQVATYMFPPIRRNRDPAGYNDRLSPQQAAAYSALTEYLTRGTEAFLAGQNRLTLPSDTDDNCARVGDGIRCRAGKCSFWITWEGYMTPCGMFPLIQRENVFEQDFTHVWQKVKQMADQIRLPVECAGCSMKDTCRACAAMVVAESGNFHDVPRYRCEMTKAYPYEYLQLAKRIEEDSL